MNCLFFLRATLVASIIFLCTPSVLAQMIGGGADGFTEAPESADTIKIYVSSSEGNDSNDGRSPDFPVASLSRGESLVRSGFPDHLLFKRGDTWKDEHFGRFKSGQSASSPIVVAPYGSDGDRPLFKISQHFINHNGQTRNYVWFMGLNVVAYRFDPDDPEFSPTGSSSSLRFVGGGDDILLEDCRLQHVSINLQSIGSNTYHRFVIRRCMVTDVYRPGSSLTGSARASGAFIDGIEGLTIEDCVFDRNGWHPTVETAGANLLNHNLYLQTGNNGSGVVVRNNIITRGSSHGIQGRAGGLFENNFFARNAISLLLGSGGAPVSDGTPAFARNNVITEGQSMVKGVDACAAQHPDFEGESAFLCTPALWGLHVVVYGNGDFQSTGNIVHSQAPDDLQWMGFFSNLNRSSLPVDDMENGNVPLLQENNIGWHWSSGTEGDNPSYPDPGRTLADYHEAITGQSGFGAFMESVRNRPLQTWDQRFTASGINDFVREGFGIGATPLQTFASWAAENSLTGDDAQTTANPDGDAYINLFEYVLGLSPTTADESVSLGVESGDVVLEYSENTQVSDYLFGVQLSEDLDSWSQTTTGSVVPGPENATLRRRLALPPGAKHFVRFHVTPK